MQNKTMLHLISKQIMTVINGTITISLYEIPIKIQMDGDVGITDRVCIATIAQSTPKIKWFGTKYKSEPRSKSFVFLAHYVVQFMAGELPAEYFLPGTGSDNEEQAKEMVSDFIDDLIRQETQEQRPKSAYHQPFSAN